jgi:hypothetical protein
MQKEITQEINPISMGNRVLKLGSGIVINMEILTPFTPHLFLFQGYWLDWKSERG